jgi:hypothetical protein
MKAPQVTPGKWISTQHSWSDVRIEKEEDTAICIASMSCWSQDYRQERNANAQLIAAAPQLAEALNALFEGYRHGITDIQLSQARAALEAAGYTESDQ